jgi:hypothetical protein
VTSIESFASEAPAGLGRAALSPDRRDGWPGAESSLKKIDGASESAVMVSDVTHLVIAT